MKHLKLYENFNQEILYHGTSMYQWERTEDGDTSLYLVNDEEDAGDYAYETSANDESNDLEPQPIICSISMNDLKKLNLVFKPDWGSSDCTEDSKWEDTYKSCGSFSVYGKIDDIKQHFKIKKIGIWSE